MLLCGDKGNQARDLGDWDDVITSRVNVILVSNENAVFMNGCCCLLAHEDSKLDECNSCNGWVIICRERCEEVCGHVIDGRGINAIESEKTLDLTIEVGVFNCVTCVVRVKVR